MLRVLIFCCIVGIAYATPPQERGVDPKMKTYVKVDGISGELKAIGSDTLHQLMIGWGDDFKKAYPDLNFSLESKGSSTAPPALIAGTSDLAPMSRKMTAEELQAFEQKHGYKPTEIGVALDALALFVHKDNPVSTLSLDQVDAIFSKSHKRSKLDITTWGQLDPKHPLADKPITLFGRNHASGTHDFFESQALLSGNFKDGIKEFADSNMLIKELIAQPAAIGYSGIGFDVAAVKAVSIIEKPGAEAREPSDKNVLNLTYPLSRMLFIYVNKNPKAPLKPATREFLAFVLSREGQTLVAATGFIPLPARAAELNLARLK